MGRVPEVPRGLLAVAREQLGLVNVSQCEAHGVTDHRRRRLVALGGWKRLAHGVYDTGQADLSRHPLDAARRRKVWLGQLARPRGAILGAGALVAAGVAGVPADFVVEMAFPGRSHYRSRAGIKVRQIEVGPHVTMFGGIRAVTLDLALAQAAGSLARGEWLACADNAVRRGLVDPELGEVRHHMKRLRMPQALRDLANLVDSRAESPIESRARLRCIDAGLVPDDLQREVFDGAGRFLGRYDLAWRLGKDRWLLVEIDSSEFHGTDEQLHHDATRQNRLIASGDHLILRYRRRHLRHDAMVREIEAVLKRERWTPRDTPPPSG
ncbi:type IV toxin-antitoxin system AbiEi family antitoxin domain-containing protein [Myceligenerans crystallogenes]|uniref:DUF559 domain-containing protein n=1 Tax=Myceligenerans crystallogenes TaxID=316335 RepID=A0ABP4ZXD7_9MICO